MEKIHKMVQEILSIVKNEPKPLDRPQYLRIDLAVEFLKSNGISISKSTLYKRHASGKLPATKIEGKLYFNVKSLNNYVQNG